LGSAVAWQFPRGVLGAPRETYAKVD
jgi:hypothetical protein